DAEVPVPGIDAASDAGRRRLGVDDRMDVGEEAEGIELWHDPPLLTRQAEEARRDAVAMPETAEAVELGGLAQRHDRIVERHALGRRTLPDAHREVLAREVIGAQGRVGAGLRGDPGKDVVPRVWGRATGRTAIEILRGDVEEAPVAYREAVVGVRLDLVAVMLVRDIPESGAPRRRAHGAARVYMLGLSLQHDVDHTGDRVRAVLRRGTVPQHLDPLDRRCGDRVEIDPHRAAAEGAVHMDERARVAPL